MNIPCQLANKECLPCRDDPIANLSAEEPDVDVFVGFNDYFGKPPLGQLYAQIGCKRICYSEVSQQEADDCALLQAQECVWISWPESPDPPLPPDDNGNPGGGPPGTPGNIPPGFPRHPIATFRNTEQCCTSECPDGQPFNYCQPAGTVGDLSQALANAKAKSLACKRANEKKLCFVNTPNSGCVGDAYSFQFLVVGGQQFNGGGYIWNSFGQLPPGLELDGSTGVLSGTPTTAGSYFFEIDVFDAGNGFNTHSFTLCIGEITTDSALPPGTIDDPYSEVLTQGLGDADNIAWTVTGGALPPGITLATDGTLAGTPTEAGSYAFTIQCAATCFGVATNCQKSFTLEITDVDCMGEAQAVEDLVWNDISTAAIVNIAGGDGTYSDNGLNAIGVRVNCQLCNPRTDPYDITVTFDWTQTTNFSVQGQAVVVLNGNTELGPVEVTPGVKQWVKVVSLPSGVNTLELRLNGGGVFVVTFNGTVTVRPLTPPPPP